MKSILAKDFLTVDLGRRGENFARQILFDLGPWREIYGEGHAELLAELPEQSHPYPCATVREDNLLIWKVSAADTSVAGKGKCELTYYVGDQLVKSAVFHTFIADSLAEPGDPPAPYTSWVNDVFRAKADAIDAKKEIENMSVSLETLPEYSTPDVIKSQKESGIHLTFRLPSASNGYTPVRGVDYFTPEDLLLFESHIESQLNERLGDLEEGLDHILDLQASLIGGEMA
ncbi:MAG: hypothetical protein E7606_03190 [Ruminococcaceae bacterium]|nr:hypothetical protein [Oscillospiraceae bacterium]